MRIVGHIQAFCRDERGATAIEYSLIVAFVFLAIVGSVHNLADGLDNMYFGVSDQVEASVERAVQ